VKTGSYNTSFVIPNYVMLRRNWTKSTKIYGSTSDFSNWVV